MKYEHAGSGLGVAQEPPPPPIPFTSLDQVEALGSGRFRTPNGAVVHVSRYVQLEAKLPADPLPSEAEALAALRAVAPRGWAVPLDPRIQLDGSLHVTCAGIAEQLPTTVAEAAEIEPDLLVKMQESDDRWVMDSGGFVGEASPAPKARTDADARRIFEEMRPIIEEVGAALGRWSSARERLADVQGLVEARVALRRDGGGRAEMLIERIDDELALILLPPVCEAAEDVPPEPSKPS